jgi:Spy/CpxP family protein refolding chaperone
MKKYVVAAALIGAIGFASFSMADARGNYGYGPGPGYGNCGGYGYCNNVSYPDADNEKANEFYEATKETRKEIFVKRSELDALMRQDNPDEKKVAKLTGEIYDLQTLMEEKADNAFGDSPRYGYGRGRGGNGNCRGPRSW